MADKKNRENAKRMEVILYPDKDDDLISFMKKQNFHNTVVLKLGLRELINKYGDGDLTKTLIQSSFKHPENMDKENKNHHNKKINKKSEVEKKKDKRPVEKKKPTFKQEKQIPTKEKHKRLPQSVFDQWDNQNFDNL